MGIFAKIFSIFRSDNMTPAQEQPIAESVPSLVKAAPVIRSAIAERASNAPGSTVTEHVVSAGGVSISFSATTSSNAGLVSSDEVALALEGFRYVWESPERSKPTDPWWEYQNHDKNLTGNPDMAYRWLSPLMPPELVNDPSIRAACTRGPHDFKAVAVALRAIVRTKRKAKEPHSQLLKSLYHVCLAAEFWPTLQHMYEYPAAIAEYVALSDWEGKMPEFGTTGYQNIPTLNKTDAKWLVAEFGEPQAHAIPGLLWPEIRANAFNRYVWCNALERAKPNLSEAEQQAHVKEWLCQRLRTRLEIAKDNQARFAASEARREYQRESSRTIDEAWAAAAGDHVVADIETTGLSTANDELLEVAAVKVNEKGKEMAHFSALVRVQNGVPGRITGLTGISQADVDNDGQPLAKVIGDFLDFVGNAPLFFHNAHFDERFLKKAAETTGYTIDNRIYDTLPMAQIAWPELESYKLVTLAEHVGASELNHRALADARATMAVLQAARKATGKVAGTPSSNQEAPHENVAV